MLSHSLSYSTIIKTLHCLGLISTTKATYSIVFYCWATLQCAMEHFPCQCIWNSVSPQGWSDRIPLCRYIPGTHPVLRKTYFVFGSKHSHQNNFSLLIWFGYELSPKDSCTDRLDIGDIWLFLMSPCCALGFLYTMKCVPLCSLLLLLGLPRRMRPTSDWM